MKRRTHQTLRIRPVPVGRNRSGIAVRVQSDGLRSVHRADDNRNSATGFGWRKSGEAKRHDRLHNHGEQTKSGRHHIGGASDMASAMQPHTDNVSICGMQRNAGGSSAYSIASSAAETFCATGLRMKNSSGNKGRQTQNISRKSFA